jgi:hypothetical protein
MHPIKNTLKFEIKTTNTSKIETYLEVLRRFIINVELYKK